MDTIKAYFDDFNVITIEVSKGFYNGDSRRFVLKGKDSKEVITEFEVTDIGDYKKYSAKIVTEIDFGEEYSVALENNLSCDVVFRGVIKKPAFDQKFYYSGDDLGVTYTEEMSIFKVWSPIASDCILNITSKGERQTYPMIRSKKGVWSVTVHQNVEGAAYTYLVKVNGKWNEATDPYAISCTPNNGRSVVVNIDKTKVELNRGLLPEFTDHTDAVIYELHVRDFSVSLTSGIEKKGKFLGLIEENTKSSIGLETGFDYLKDLGFTHLQLLPIYDFGSVDEYNQFEIYNWGYDPVQYNVVEGSYSTDPSDPYARIIELKHMISRFHEHGIRINMDVVYNHMFDLATSPFEKIFPGYYFRYGDDLTRSNGSFCGNDVESRALMMRKFIVESVKFWHEFYGVDGFRFDLMGILDTKTMNAIRQELPQDVMLYGEGWQMPTLMPQSEMASMFNYDKIPQIGHFNDRFRDSIKGKTSHDEAGVGGFITGDLKHTDTLCSSLTASVVKYGHSDKMFDEPYQSVNYLECHDNHTLYDKIRIVHPEEDVEISKARQRLGAFIIMVSQGISFLHAGQEFLRTKDFDHNSYKSSDEVNKIDWDLKDGAFIEVRYVKELIALRKAFKPFRFNTKREIKKHVKVTKINEGFVKYQIKNVSDYCDYSEIDVYINGTDRDLQLSISGEYDLYALDNRASSTPIETIKNNVQIKALSGTIIMKK